MSALAAVWQAWIVAVAGLCAAMQDKWRPPRVLRLIANADGTFDLPDVKDAPGGRIECVLAARDCVVRPFDVPARAADFVTGIVRAQIDRLTPWPAGQALFGCTPPRKGSGDTMTTDIVATGRRQAMAAVAAVAPLRPQAVTVLAQHDGRDVALLVHAAQPARGARLPNVLNVVLIASIAAFAVATAAAAIVGSGTESERAAVAAQISARRAALRSGDAAAARTPSLKLEQRRRDEAPSVLVLEALARLLPDHTYVTDLHLAGDRLRVGGITRDAPALIALLESSKRFARATFSAPTTYAARERGERFQIEAQIVAGEDTP